MEDLLSPEAIEQAELLLNEQVEEKLKLATEDFEKKVTEIQEIRE